MRQAEPGSPTRVVIVDDDMFVRSGLRTVLGTAHDIEVVGEAADGADVEQAVDRWNPDVVLMDIRMPGVDGIVATERLQQRTSPPRVLVLTTFDLDRYVLDALRAGAAGFLLKDATPLQIIDAVHVIAAGDAILAPSATRALLEHYADPDAAARRREARRRLADLTSRERDVADRIAEGLSNAEVGARLGLTEKTVTTYASQVLRKLGVANRVQVALTVREARD